MHSFQHKRVYREYSKEQHNTRQDPANNDDNDKQLNRARQKITEISQTGRSQQSLKLPTINYFTQRHVKTITT